MAKREEKLDKILNPMVTISEPSINVVNNYDMIKESEDEIRNKVEEPLNNQIARIFRRSQNNTSNQRNWYHQPFFPDIQFEEKNIKDSSSL